MQPTNLTGSTSSSPKPTSPTSSSNDKSSFFGDIVSIFSASFRDKEIKKAAKAAAVKCKAMIEEADKEHESSLRCIEESDKILANRPR